MLSGVENYTRAIEFKCPDYVPVIMPLDFDWLYDRNPAKLERIRALQRRLPDDLLVVNESARNVHDPETAGGVTRWTDHWGTGWENDGHGIKTEAYPLEPGYHLMATHAFPSPHATGLFAKADEALAARGDRYVVALVWFTLFERLWMLRGFSNMLVDPYVEPDGFRALRNQVLDYALAMVDQWLERDVNGVYFSDDWGSQRGLLIDPGAWRIHYRPAYEQLFGRVRERGAHVWMHLCGNIIAILPDLIELGLNVLNPVQPQAMNVHKLSEEFGGKVCFFGGVDIQGTLINGTPSDVKREVAMLVEIFGRYKGGYIASTSHRVMPETPLDNVIALYEALIEAGRTHGKDD